MVAQAQMDGDLWFQEEKNIVSHTFGVDTT